MHTCARVLSAPVRWGGLWLGVFIVVCKYLQPFTLEKHTTNQPFPQSSCLVPSPGPHPLTHTVTSLILPAPFPVSWHLGSILPVEVTGSSCPSMWWLLIYVDLHLWLGLKKETVVYKSTFQSLGYGVTYTIIRLCLCHQSICLFVIKI